MVVPPSGQAQAQGWGAQNHGGDSLSQLQWLLHAPSPFEKEVSVFCGIKYHQAWRWKLHLQREASTVSTASPPQRKPVKQGLWPACFQRARGDVILSSCANKLSGTRCRILPPLGEFIRACCGEATAGLSEAENTSAGGGGVCMQTEMTTGRSLPAHK